jgi:hypothetical protein
MRERTHVGEYDGESFIIRQIILLDISVDWTMIKLFLYFEDVNWM